MFSIIQTTISASRKFKRTQVTAVLETMTARAQINHLIRKKTNSHETVSFTYDKEQKANKIGAKMRKK